PRLGGRRAGAGLLGGGRAGLVAHTCSFIGSDVAIDATRAPARRGARPPCGGTVRQCGGAAVPRGLGGPSREARIPRSRPGGPTAAESTEAAGERRAACSV